MKQNAEPNEEDEKKEDEHTFSGYIMLCLISISSRVKQNKETFFKSFILRLIYETEKDHEEDLFLWSRENHNNKMPVCCRSL